jgi:hypothetical protein
MLLYSLLFIISLVHSYKTLQISSPTHIQLNMASAETTETSIIKDPLLLRAARGEVVEQIPGSFLLCLFSIFSISKIITML